MDFLSESLKGRLLFAIPKKGRLYEHCLTLLSGADIQFTRSNRLDVCLVRNHNLALVFLPAADIPRFVGEGNVDLGITGKDMVAEASAAEMNLPNPYASASTSGSSTPANGEQANGRTATAREREQDLTLADLIEEVLPLAFGSCKLQVQVPERSTNLKSVEDLVGKKIATSFDGLSNKFFKELDAKVNAERGLTGDKKLKTKIEYVGGSVEAACALGVADGIVDLVESGETMRAAGLHAIHTLMGSEAVLIRSSRSSQKSSEHPQLINMITSRIAGVIAAAKYVLCNYNVPRKNLDAATAITPGRRAATVSPLDDPEWVAVSSMVERKNVATIMDRLTETGASDILIIGINNCRV